MKPSKHSLCQILLVLLLLYSCGENAKTDTNNSEDIESILKMTLTTESEEAKENFGEGLYQFYVGDIIESRKLFDAAVSSDPQFALAYTYRAYTSQGPKDFASYSKMASDKSENVSEPEKLLIDINQTFLTNDLESRISIAESLVEKYPKNFVGRLELSNAYSASNRYIESRRNLVQTVSDHPDKARPLLNLASSYIFEDPKNLAKAEEYAKKSVEVIPDISSTHIMLGDVYRAQNNLEAALNSYKKASEINPENFVALSKQGHANTFLGNYEEARANYMAADQLDDEGIGMVNFRILTDVYSGNYEKALNAYTVEIENIDGSKSSLMNSNRSGLLNSAMMVAFHAKDSELLENLLDKYRDAQIKVAEDVGTDEINTVIKSGLKIWDSRLALLNNDLESAKASIEEYKTMMEPIKNPNKMNGYHMGMGLIAMAEGKASTAIEHLEQVDAQNIYALYHLAKALEMDGQSNEAMEHYKYLSSYNFNGTSYALIRSECISMINT